ARRGALDGRRSRSIGQLRRVVHAEILRHGQVGGVGDDVVDKMAGGGSSMEGQNHNGFGGRRTLQEACRPLLSLIEEEADRAERLVERVPGVEAHERQLVGESGVWICWMKRAQAN